MKFYSPNKPKAVRFRPEIANNYIFLEKSNILTGNYYLVFILVTTIGKKTTQ